MACCMASRLTLLHVHPRFAAPDLSGNVAAIVVPNLVEELLLFAVNSTDAVVFVLAGCLSS